VTLRGEGTGRQQQLNAEYAEKVPTSLLAWRSKTRAADAGSDRRLRFPIRSHCKACKFVGHLPPEIERRDRQPRLRAQASNALSKVVDTFTRPALRFAARSLHQLDQGNLVTGQKFVEIQHAAPKMRCRAYFPRLSVVLD
jgi:hypothetical protein